jgi:hypothetical protein
MERTGKNSSSILAQRWPRVIANQYNMQHDVVITHVVSTVAQNWRQAWTTAFTPPWFSPACHRSLRLAARYLPRSRPQGEPRRNVTPWASESPTTLTCMRLCIRAWHPINGVPLPDASPIQPVAGQGEERMTRGHAFYSATSLPPALPCGETENLSISYTRSILHQKQRFVKRLGN